MTDETFLREALDRCAEIMRKPGPLLDRKGNPVADEEGYAIPDMALAIRAVESAVGIIEKLARLAATEPGDDAGGA